jgi:hypothetical protein
MAKAKKKSTTTAGQRAIRQASRVEYEVDRYRWLCGNKPMAPLIMSAPVMRAPTAPTLKPKERKRPQGDRVQQSMRRLYGGVPARAAVKTAVAVRAIIADLKAENKRLGINLLDPSRPAIERVLGRR